MSCLVVWVGMGPVTYVLVISGLIQLDENRGAGEMVRQLLLLQRAQVCLPPSAWQP